jgi:hypothetical protein
MTNGDSFLAILGGFILDFIIALATILAAGFVAFSLA